MTDAVIKEYLQICVDVEKDSYTQDRLMAQMEDMIGKLGYAQQFWVPQKKELHGCYNEAGNFGLMGALAFFFGCMISFSPIIILGVILFVIAAFYASEGNKRVEAAEEEYQAELEKYNNRVKRDDQRVENELKRKAILQAELENLREAHAKTQKHLQSLYDCNIIHPKYRGLIPVCSLYGYFDTGVCTQLEGHEGAYNKYDNESRLDYIICKMDEVIKHLEDIKSNQYQLYSAIQESSEKCDRLIANTSQMVTQLNGIQAQGTELNARIAQLQTTSDLTLYEAACNRQELAYLNRVTEWGY